MDEQIYIGSALKALDDSGRVGSHGIRFTDDSHKDLDGEYFTAKTYLGAREGDGADCLMHHMQPMKGVPRDLTDHIFKPVKATRDDIGIFVETVLDLSDEYEKQVFELVKAGKLAWSSGAPAHTVIKSQDGEIKRWIVAEFSFTPTPAEPQNKVISLKSYAQMLGGDTSKPQPVKGMFEDMLSERTSSLYFLSDLFMSGCYQLMYMDEMAEDTSTPFNTEEKFNELSTEYIARVRAAILDDDREEDGAKAMLLPLKSAVSALPLNRHSEAMVSISKEFATQTAAFKSLVDDFLARSQKKQEFRIKEGRTISQATRDRMKEMHGHTEKAVEHVTEIQKGLQGLITLAEPKEEAADPMKCVSEIQANILRRRTKMRLAEVA